MWSVAVHPSTGPLASAPRMLLPLPSGAGALVNVAEGAVTSAPAGTVIVNRTW